MKKSLENGKWNCKSSKGRNWCWNLWDNSSGGSKEKPIGMVCFGIQINNMNYTFTEYFQSQYRNEIRNSSVEFILNKLLELI